MKNIFLSIGLLAAVNASYAQPGALDPAFGNGGKVVGDFGAMNYTRAYATVVQPDGKILVGGSLDNATLPDAVFLVARYNTDGTLDNTFDGDGWVTTDFPVAGVNACRALALQPDGKIVAVGVGVIVRYNTNGSLDLSFDGDGKSAGHADYTSLAIQADGKILAAGKSAIIGYLDRFNANGTLDINFGTSANGIGIGFDNGGPAPIVEDAVAGVTVQPDGNILVAGWGRKTKYQYGIARITPDGQGLESTFAGSGVATGNSWADLDRFNAIVLQPDGKILVAGIAGNYTTLGNDFALLRFKSNGRLDSSFGNAGIARAFMVGTYNHIYSLSLQGDGRIVAGGTTAGVGGSTFAVLRFNPGGSLDNSFDGDGKVTTEISAQDDIIYSTAIQADGKIVAAGFGVNDQNFTVVRYLGGNGVDVKELENKPGLTVYPNPGNGLFAAETAKAGVAYTVTDVNGRLVSSGTTTKGQTTVDLTKYANGMYLLQIEKETVKLVKQ